MEENNEKAKKPEKPESSKKPENKNTQSQNKNSGNKAKNKPNVKNSKTNKSNEKIQNKNGNNQKKNDFKRKNENNNLKKDGNQVVSKEETKKDNNPGKFHLENKKEETKEKKAEVKQEKQEKKKNENTKIENNKKDSSSKKNIICAVIIAILVLACLICFAVFHKKTIDLSKYVDVEFEGYDGYADIKKIEINDKLENYLGDEKLYDRFCDKIELKAENSENLSNGDEVEIDASISSSFLKNNKLKLKDDKVKIKVNGLEEADVIDVFGKDFEVDVKGISPNLTISVNNNSKEDFIKNYVTYSVDKYSGLANGDTVTITAYYDKSKANSLGIVVAKETYKYEIKNQPKYIDKSSELSSGNLDKIKSKMLDKVKSEITNSGNSIITYNYDETSYNEEFTNTDPEFVGAYLLTQKGKNSWNSNNIIYGIYKVTYTSKTSGKTYDWFFIADVENVAVSNNSLYKEEDLKYSVSGKWDDGKTEKEAYDDIIDSKKGSYVIEEVK